MKTVKNYLKAANLILATFDLDLEQRAEYIESKTGVPAEWVLEVLEDVRFEIMAKWENTEKVANELVNDIMNASKIDLNGDRRL